jgi:hypothetical protein
MKRCCCRAHVLNGLSSDPVTKTESVRFRARVQTGKPGQSLLRLIKEFALLYAKNFSNTVRKPPHRGFEHGYASHLQQSRKTISSQLPIKMKIATKLLFTASLFLFTAFFVDPARATLTTVTWDLNPTGIDAPVGSSSHVFISQGYSITAYGFDVGNGINPARSLFYKNAGGDEFGLGVVGTPHNELQVTSNGSPANFIQLDLRAILAAGFTNGKIDVGSVQANESFVLYGSNSLGSLGTKLGNTYGSNFDLTFLNAPNFGSYQFLAIAAGSADVLPVAFQADINLVPEIQSLFPIIGLMIAVISTETLRRRHIKKH